MDTSSPEKCTGVLNNEYGATHKADLNAHENIEGFGLDSSNYENKVPSDENVCSNSSYTSPSMHMHEVNDRAHSTSMESNLVNSLLVDTKPEEMEGTVKPNTAISGVQGVPSAVDIEEVGNPIKDYQKVEVFEADINTAASICNFAENEGITYHPNNPLERGDSEHDDKTSAPDEVMNSDYGHLPANSQAQERELIEMNYENLDTKTNHESQVRESCYSLDTVPPETVEMVWEHSSLQSSQENQNVSHSPERRLSVSAERSPCKQSPSKSPAFIKQEIQSPTNLDCKQVPSPLASSRRYSLSPEKTSPGRQRNSSRDHSSPSARRKSPVRASKREAHHRDDSPKRRISRSPQKQYSPRRTGRSASKSPTRRRYSPRNQRNHRRSRSRSPIARDHNRRSPSKRSPRRRSPPTYRSDRRSLRRPWSPPSNRNTGIGKPGRNLYVAGFSYGTTERDLERKFSKFGRVTDVRVVRERSSGDSRGFGFLSLERDEDADAAIRAVDQSEWNGRIILVEKSRSSSRRS